jgi:hypothetical protein
MKFVLVCLLLGSFAQANAQVILDGKVYALVEREKCYEMPSVTTAKSDAKRLAC